MHAVPASDGLLWELGVWFWRNLAQLTGKVMLMYYSYALRDCFIVVLDRNPVPTYSDENAPNNQKKLSRSLQLAIPTLPPSKAVIRSRFPRRSFHGNLLPRPHHVNVPSKPSKKNNISPFRLRFAPGLSPLASQARCRATRESRLGASVRLHLHGVG